MTPLLVLPDISNDPLLSVLPHIVLVFRIGHFKLLRTFQDLLGLMLRQETESYWTV